VRLLAISDLHVAHPQNRAFVESIPACREDWLVLAGDIAERAEDLRFVLESLRPKFAKLFWTPGNHELWTLNEAEARGEARYLRLVDLCREYDVLTPEDPYAVWPDLSGPRLVIAPLFLLYDYSFRPAEVPLNRALAWAEESGIMCTDEMVLHPDPYPSREAWCAARCDLTEARLAALEPDVSTVLINHFPLRRSHAYLPLIPRFSIWCGTTRTEDWHRRFRARAVVFGHLHIRQTRDQDGVRFHEVSLGYPRQWTLGEPRRYLRQIWPPEGRVAEPKTLFGALP
jgi:3',5'-cyclic AMP phosphodiesterase CpdA